MTGANGVRLQLADGQQPIDAMSSWWATIHGHRHPALDAAVHGQLDQMAHVMFGGLTHEPAIRLTTTLAQLAPGDLEHVFLADSGSVAVEVALKMAVQAQRGLGHPGRTRIAALRGGYHGDTHGAMSVCDPVGGMHSMFAGSLVQQTFLPRPPATSDALGAWEVAAADVLDSVTDLAAVIVEPVLQGAGGMHTYPPAVLRWLRAACDERGLLLIADEIATGLWRTGRRWAVDHAGVTPDVLCTGKALTGGYLTLAATITTRRVSEAIEGSESGALMHGPTFMGNPLACAVALASLDLLESTDPASVVSHIEHELLGALAPAAELPGVAAVRAIGAVGVVQLDRPVDVDRASAVALEHGVWIRPFRDLIYTMPPYVCTDEDLAAIGGAVVTAAADQA